MVDVLLVASSRYSGPEVRCDGSRSMIPEAQCDAACRFLSGESSGAFGDTRRHRMNFHSLHQVVDEGLPASPLLLRFRSLDSMRQLGHRDHGDSGISLNPIPAGSAPASASRLVPHALSRTFRRDDDAGICNQSPRGGFQRFRWRTISSTSAAKSAAASIAQRKAPERTRSPKSVCRK
jgi:hypothetical protein